MKSVMKSMAAALALVLSMPSASAAVLTMKPGAKSIEGVNVSVGATAQTQAGPVELATVGSGLRQKKVALFWVKVYVAQLLVNAPNQFTRTDAGALDSVAAMNSVAVRLDFVRSVDAATVRQSFKDALSVNGVNLNDTGIQAFLQLVDQGGDADNGHALTILLERLADGTEMITYENTHGAAAAAKGQAGLLRAILSIWLGKPADSGVAKLKADLIGG
jgi:hypothetical protein